jgi:hypothetical protein
MWRNLTTAIVRKRKGGIKECVENLGGGREGEGEKKKRCGVQR